MVHRCHDVLVIGIRLSISLRVIDSSGQLFHAKVGTDRYEECRHKMPEVAEYSVRYYPPPRNIIAISGAVGLNKVRALVILEHLYVMTRTY